jgi:hypothetical protein
MLTDMTNISTLLDNEHAISKKAMPYSQRAVRTGYVSYRTLLNISASHHDHSFISIQFGGLRKQLKNVILVDLHDPGL